MLVETKSTASTHKVNVSIKGKPGKALKNALESILNILEGVTKKWVDLHYSRFAAFPYE